MAAAKAVLGMVKDDDMQDVEEGNSNGAAPTSTKIHRRPLRFTIGFKLALFVGILTLLTVGVMAVLAWATSSRLLSAQISERMNTIALLRAQHLTMYIANTLGNLQLISSRVLIQNYLKRIVEGGNMTEFELDIGENDLRSAVSSYQGMVMIEFLLPNGSTIFQTTRDDISLDTLDAVRYRPGDSLTSGFKLYNPIRLPSGLFVWALTAPVKSLSNASMDLGMVHIVTETLDIGDILWDRAGLGDTGQLVLVAREMNDEYRFVMPPERHPEVFNTTNHQLSEYEALSTAVQHNSSGVTTGTSYDGTLVVTSYQFIPHGNYILLAEQSSSEINGPIHRLRFYLLMGIIANLVATLLISIFAAQYIVVPIRRLRTLALTFSRGDFSARAICKEGTFSDEIRELNQAFNTMAVQLSSQYEVLERRVQERTEELAAAKREADGANAAKSAFLAAITHELRTPLNGIIGLSALLAETSLNEDQKDLISSIRECSDGLLIIVNDVLDFSKIEAGKLELESRPFDLQQCIENALYLLNLKASQKGLILSHRIEPSTPTFIMGDTVRLRQILINLVGNSVKFTSEGYVLVTVTARANGSNTVELKFQVEDTGIGIPSEALGRLFQSFSQVDSSTTRQYGGTGLGLAICKQLVQMMGGTIWVTSEQGKGSVFSFTISTSVVSSNKITKKTEAKEELLHDLADRYPMRLLMAEDNAVNTKLATRMLQRLGYTVDVVTNGADAVEAVNNRPYDLILMDMQMPIMNGLDATMRIRADRKIDPQPIIIALTANAMDTDRIKCLQAGMDHHLSKPIKLEVLAEALEIWGARIATNRIRRNTMASLERVSESVLQIKSHNWSV
ncbi:uncharacterized protein SPPG_00641 [Spizellomyces punctatus DAOM BR117]|uniref:histidine kinase n=1 Tax=Spizellomyces punctatus (strain DAOM BR117) TaxID=645134 RepID=A0A0L0HV11_SPIPD|nr:uncharacterized protein SPPG_00641 [Spizellomyces punctatus DAOM BR117]KND04953.1 hypothetical protein SPPG_00641 [Spizellomyces punctatus DAOM BR117]|eukprot:XP_016612992.1 hypothetical protein SPPG_00641 [Spizellomyces punctatus DAOM BR117]